MIEAAGVCAVTKLLLTTMPYRIVNSLMAEISRGADHRSIESNREEIDRIIRAVNAAGKFIPGAKNCLVRAISAKVILGSAGSPGDSVRDRLSATAMARYRACCSAAAHHSSVGRRADRLTHEAEL